MNEQCGFSRKPVETDAEAARVVEWAARAAREHDLHGVASELDFAHAYLTRTPAPCSPDVAVDDAPPIIIVPASARAGIAALETVEDAAGDEVQRTEYGTVECQVIGLTRYYYSPAIIVIERLSREKVICVLTPELAAEMGPEHQWSEAWEGRNLRIGGKLSFGADGKLKRINAQFQEPIEWADVSLEDLAHLDITEGRTVRQHLEEFWGEKFG